MPPMKRHLPLFVLILVLICIQGCGVVGENVAPVPAAGGAGVLYPTRLPPAQQYAGEVLAYMIQVVTGHAGQPGLRGPWRACGVGSGLGLRDITDILVDPAGDKGRLMLFDMNVRGLSKVLYHYDARLNQFKGAHSIDGVYPSAELIALRLLLVDLMDQGRRADLDALYRLMSTWTAPGAAVSPIEKDAAGLSGPQLALLRSVLAAEPDMGDYLHHPFLVDALAKVGVVRDSALVRRITGRANYRRLRPSRAVASGRRPAVVAVLPSIIGGYRVDTGDGLNAWGVSPDPEYTRAVGKMKQEITEAFRGASAAGDSGPGEIAFLDFDARPLVVHPGNADAVIGDLCPDADIVIIIFGQNVDRSVYLDADHDIFPSTNRFYFDIMDVKYERIAEEIAAIGRAAARGKPATR